MFTACNRPALPGPQYHRPPSSGIKEKAKQNEEVAMNAFQGFPRITPFLWFDSNAEEAVNFYLTVFKNSRRLDELRKPDGGMLTIAFELDGEKFTALNGGPMF